MRFQDKLGQTKVVFNNQGKNAPQCITFWLEIFLFKIEIACGKTFKLEPLNCSNSICICEM